MKILKNQDLSNHDLPLGKLSEDYLNTRLKMAFLSYSMSVITSRALPDVRDGLKPIHRRILYSMYEIKLFPNSQFKKSAKIVGEVIAKYHPHGDAAVYGTLVRMGQDFNYRYPFIIPQGNFGSVDGDSPAAMRYTEAKMSKYSTEMTRDINYETVEFKSNYDNSESEPTVLPSRLPNLLLNGSDGIAVGMATSIPPHNFSEILDATIFILNKLINSETYTINDLLQFIKGPDFPTGALILKNSKLVDIYKYGRGSVIIRSKHKIEISKSKKNKKIVFTEIPYFVNKSNLVQNIANHIENSTNFYVRSIRDESNRFGIRIVIEIDNSADTDLILNNLFKNTQLQTSYHCKFLALVNESPKENLSVKEILNEYIFYQHDIIFKRSTYFIRIYEHKLNIALGVYKAITDIDNVVNIIKNSAIEKDAIDNLIKKLKLNEIQAKYVLKMRLNRLVSVERKTLKDEIKELSDKIMINKNIIESKENIYLKVKEEIEEYRQKYNFPRRSSIVEFNDEIDDSSLISSKDIIITLSTSNMIKSQPSENFRLQNRSGVGIKSTSLYNDDHLILTIKCNILEQLYLFTNIGRIYFVNAFKIPEASRISKGTSIVNIVPGMQKNNERCISIINLNSLDTFDYIVFLTYKGKVKKLDKSHVKKIYANGKIVINITGYKDHIVNVLPAKEGNNVMIISNKGNVVYFPLSKVRSSGRNTYGVSGMNVKNQNPSNLLIVDGKKDEKILYVSEYGYGKIINLFSFSLRNRNITGLKCMKITNKTGLLKFSEKIEESDSLFLSTNSGQSIVIPINQIPILKGRNTSGVRLIKLKKGEKIVSIHVFTKPLEITVEDKDEKNNIQLEK